MEKGRGVLFPNFYLATLIILEYPTHSMGEFQMLIYTILEDFEALEEGEGLEDRL